MTTFGWAILAVLALLAAAALVLSRLRPAHPAPTRESARVAVAVPVRLRLGEHVVEATSADVSRGGMCLRGAIHASAGQPVELDFILPNQVPLHLYGVVRWHKRDGLGVLFDLHDKNRRLVGDWIEAQQSAPVSGPEKSPGLPAGT